MRDLQAIDFVRPHFRKIDFVHSLVLHLTVSSVRSCLGWPLPCFFHVYGYRPLSTHTTQRPILAPAPAQKLSPEINVELVGDREVFGQHGIGVAHRGELLQSGRKFAY